MLLIILPFSDRDTFQKGTTTNLRHVPVSSWWLNQQLKEHSSISESSPKIAAKRNIVETTTSPATSTYTLKTKDEYTKNCWFGRSIVAPLNICQFLCIGWNFTDVPGGSTRKESNHLKSFWLFHEARRYTNIELSALDLRTVLSLLKLCFEKNHRPGSPGDLDYHQHYPTKTSCPVAYKKMLLSYQSSRSLKIPVKLHWVTEKLCQKFHSSEFAEAFPQKFRVWRDTELGCAFCDPFLA